MCIYSYVASTEIKSGPSFYCCINNSQDAKQLEYFSVPLSEQKHKRFLWFGLPIAFWIHFCTGTRRVSNIYIKCDYHHTVISVSPTHKYAMIIADMLQPKEAATTRIFFRAVQTVDMYE